jgi:hypothetical protein
VGAIVGLSTINGSKFDRVSKLNRMKEIFDISFEEK